MAFCVFSLWPTRVGRTLGSRSAGRQAGHFFMAGWIAGTWG